MDLVPMSLTLVVLISLLGRTYSAECEDEVLIPEGGKHEHPRELLTTEIFIDNTDILYGDIVNAMVDFVYASITVQSEMAPIKFAEKKLTEISVTVQGARMVEMGYEDKNESLIHTVYYESISDPEKETRLNVPVEEVTADSIITRVYKSSDAMSIKVSDMVLKACKEIDIDHCKPDSCLNGGTCKDGINSFTCQCAEGFDGPSCGNNIDDCKSDSCLNGGTCQDEINSFTCQCAEGFDGSTCGNNINDCKPDSCLNGGTCQDEINSYTCQCAEGFDGPTCENNIDECESSPCNNGGTCIDGINEFSCDCLSGFKGATCEIAPRCQTIRCTSKDCGRTECTLEEATVITKVTLKESFKNSSCYYYGYPAPGDYLGGDPGYFGYKDNSVWVDNGCKASFEVCY